VCRIGTRLHSAVASHPDWLHVLVDHPPEHVNAGGFGFLNDRVGRFAGSWLLGDFHGYPNRLNPDVVERPHDFSRLRVALLRGPGDQAVVLPALLYVLW
jgi:hypothetical protein